MERSAISKKREPLFTVSRLVFPILLKKTSRKMNFTALLVVQADMRLDVWSEVVPPADLMPNEMLEATGSAVMQVSKLLSQQMGDFQGVHWDEGGIKMRL